MARASQQGVIAAWLSKPLRVAWKTKQSADHPTEMYFTKKDGCVWHSFAAKTAFHVTL